MFRGKSLQYAGDMSGNMPGYMGYIPRICWLYDYDMPRVCLRYALIMPKICLNHAKYTLTTDQNMHNICPKYNRFALFMSKICKRYAKIPHTGDPNLSTDANRSTDTEKLDGVAPLISHPPPTSSTTLSSTMQNHYMI